MLFYYHAITLVFLLGFAAYDHRHHRIRNAALLAFLPWCLLYIPAALQEMPACLVLLRCFLGALCGFLLLLTVSLATGGGIGGGDIKLAALLGIPFGESGLMAVLALSCICTGYCPKLFVKYREIYLLDAEGVPHTLLIGKDHKIRTGCSYRFYFLSPPDFLKEDSPWLEKAMLADSLLGMELLENVPVSGTASPSNMDL